MTMSDESSAAFKSRRKFTREQVSRARKTYELLQQLRKSKSLRELADEWGVSPMSVSRMASGKTYKRYTVS